MRQLAIALVLLVVTTAFAGQNPNIEIFVEFDNGMNYTEPPTSTVISAYVCFTNFGAGGGMRAAAFRLNRTFSAAIVGQQCLLPGCLTLGDPEADGVVVSGDSCTYPDGFGVVQAYRIDYFYMGTPGVIEVLPDVTYGNVATDCNFADDNWCVRSVPSGNGGVHMTPPAGNCADPTLWHVSEMASGFEDGSAAYPFDTIQEGIDAASEGDTVLVAPGTYSGNGNRDLDFDGTNLTLLSSGGAAVTHIDCGGTPVEYHQGFYFHAGEDSTSVVDGFTVSGGYHGTGGAFIMFDLSRPTLRNLILTGNYAQGAAIWCQDSGAIVEDCTITMGAGLDTFNYDGGGIYSYNSNLRLEDVTISGFVLSDGEGAGIYCEDSTLQMVDCVVDSNQCPWLGAGAGIRAVNSSVTITGGLVTNGEIGFAGGGGDGAGVSVQGGQLTMSDVTVSGNECLGNGGGLHCSDCSISLSYVTLSGNDAGDTPFPGNGGAIYLDTCSGTISDCTVSGNSAAWGGGGLCGGEGVTIERTTFSNNYVFDGHGGAIEGSPDALTDVLFLYNYADGAGGGIYGATSTAFTRVTFDDNIAAILTGGGVSGGNGATFVDCVFIDNVSGSGAPGSAISCNGTTSLTGCTFRRNEGQAVIYAGSSAVLSNTLIAFNSYEAITGSATLTCCDVYGNPGGDWTSNIAAQLGVNGNISEDPLFCPESNWLVGLQASSPCAAENNPGCGQIGARGVNCAGGVPWIEEISDVGNDQGQEVRLKWLRTYHDNPSSPDPVTSYGIYRRQDGNRVADATGAGTERGTRLEGWDYVGSAPARCDSIYQFVAPTLCDSTAAEGMCWSVFFVSAETATPSLYYDSPPDSGYSVDNLAPEMPRGLTAEDQLDRITLAWDEAEEEDFDYYAVYRDTVQDFEPGSPIGYSMTPSFEDVDPQYSVEYWYRVTTWDMNGNESEPSASASATATSIEATVVERVALGPIVPNPFASSVTAHYYVPADMSGSEIEVSIYDAAGRLVRGLAVGRAEPGPHEVVWDGRDSSGTPAASGMYFCRLEIAGVRRSAKIVRLEVAHRTTSSNAAEPVRHDLSGWLFLAGWALALSPAVRR